MYTLWSSFGFGLVVFIFLSRMMAGGSLPPSSTVVQPAASSRVNNQDSTVAIPNGWKKIDADGKFTFYLPPDMRVTGVGIENYHREYSNGKLNVSFDYEGFQVLAYENRARLGKNFEERTLEIDGRKSYLFFYENLDIRKRPYYTADLSIGDLPKGDVKLRMWISCWRPARLKEAEIVFRSIQFNTR